MSKIYRDTEGAYHDLTAANLDEWPPEDESLLSQPLQTVDLVAAGGEGGTPDSNPGEPTTFGEDADDTGEDARTVEPSGSDVPPVAAEPDPQVTAKTRRA